MSVSRTIAVRDFGLRTVASLEARGIRFVGIQAIPGAGALPFANAERGYVLDDNGTGRVLSYLEVRAL
jgi:hypothetical protein